MLRHPFFILFMLVFLFSCKEKTKAPVLQNTAATASKSFQNKAMFQLKNNAFNSAFFFFNKSKILSESIKDSANIAYDLIQMASIQQINGDYYGSKQTLTEALPYVKKNALYLASIYNFFGIADKELFLYEDALLSYQMALKIATDSVSKNSPLNNIAVVYIKQKKYDKAIRILESILNNNESSKLPLSTKARLVDNLGYAYFKKGNLNHSLKLLNDGFTIRNQIKDSYGNIESNLHLAEYYSRINPEKSVQHAQTAYQTATQFNSIDERLNALSFLISTDLSKKNIQYAQHYVRLNDSIKRIRNNFKNKFAKIKYEAKKEKYENQQLRLEKAENLVSLQRANYQSILFLLAFIALFLILIYIRKLHFDKTKIIKIKTAYDTETRIAKNLHDELANDVFQAITFAQTQPLSNENTKEILIQKLDNL
ncbi:tetratricopeptide repeat protein [Flavobacterium agrisoli]|uniref:tetratricopeptide repeat protein n=1 Tax=Flavobacterium agrisoli TaxID=2793066 RepID=UPI00293D4E96|nr:tetratricopeptide repeat protein [Flavobacterium agrisoli]